MEKTTELAIDEQDNDLTENEAIDQAFLQMQILYKSRCVQPPFGSNVTIREIVKDE